MRPANSHAGRRVGGGPAQNHREIHMDSALNPREIQTRIRAGESVDQVARAAGIPAEQVEAFASPVLAEREHQANTALGSPVRRRGETGSHRSLSAVVGERLQSRGIDPDTVEWDAWRGENRIWTVQGRYRSESAEHQVLFHFDTRARFSTAANDEASSLIGEASPARGPQPGRRRPGADPDTEPTVDLNDERALQRAKADAGEMTVPLPHRPSAHSHRPAAGQTDRPDAAASAGSDVDDDPGLAREPGVDDYLDTQLEQVDGVYDFVPSDRGQLDNLYDMLSSFNEDSVNIYAGLTEPPAPEAHGDDAETGPEADPDAASEPPRPEAARPERRRGGPPRPHTRDVPKEAQEPLVEEPADAPQPEQQAKPKRRKRASVPTWDEIMFGGPRS